VVDTWHNAVRVVANSITHLNRGANAIVLYRLTDTHWHKTGWGMVTPLEKPEFEPKPVYHAITHALKELPLESTILSPLWYSHDDAITLSILHQKDEGSLHILAVNSTGSLQTKEISLSKELSEIELKELSTLIETGASDATVVKTDNGILTIEMPPLSIARIQLGSN